MRASTSTSGFSLLETSIVLVILATIATGLLALGAKKAEQNRYDQTRYALDEVESALKAFVEKGGYLPCPASPSAAPGSATFGVADDCAAATPALANITVSGTGTNEEVWIGAVPTRTLSLPDSLMYDAMGNRLRYTVMKKLAIDTEGVGEFCSTVTTGGIRIMDAYGNQIPPAATNSVVAYALVSFGKDAVGAYQRNGAAGTACPAASTVVREENCDADQTFIDAAYNDGTVAASYFDDMVRWKFVYQVVADGDLSKLGACYASLTPSYATAAFFTPGISRMRCPLS